MENTNGCYREKGPKVRYYSTSEFRYLIGEVRESGESTLHVIVERPDGSAYLDYVHATKTTPGGDR